jgi:hypothetical protein
MSAGRGGFPRGVKAELAAEQMTILIDFTGYRRAWQHGSLRASG